MMTHSLGWVFIPFYLHVEVVNARLNKRDVWTKIQNESVVSMGGGLSRKDVTNGVTRRRAVDSSNTNPSYYYSTMYQLKDSNSLYDDFQLAWRFLGFYMDCTPYGGSCLRQAVYAVYFDPNYEGGGIGEYMYYDKNSNEFQCYAGGSCKRKMDCHLSDTGWKLLGVYKIENILGNYGFLGQLSQHEGYCLWGQDTYNFMSTMRSSMPHYCTQTKQSIKNGSYLHYAMKPSVNGTLTLGLYSDYKCSKEYTETNIDAYELMKSQQSDWQSLNEALNVFQQCQPCISYDLSSNNAFTCSDTAGYTDANMCLKLSRKSHSKSASKDDIILATRQQSLVSFEMDGVTYGGVSDEFGNMSWYMNNVTKRSASIALPFSLPELPGFFSSWFFLGFCTFSILILGLYSCCKMCCCRNFNTTDRSIPLIDETFLKEPPLEKSVANPLNDTTPKSNSNTVKSRKSKVKIGMNKDNVKDQGEDSIELCRVSYKSTACQTSLNQISHTSQTTLKQILKTLSDNISKKQQKNERKEGGASKKEDFACQTSLDEVSPISAIDNWSKSRKSNTTKIEGREHKEQIKSVQPRFATINGLVSQEEDCSCQTSLGKLQKIPHSEQELVTKDERDEKIKKSKPVEQVDVLVSGNDAEIGNKSDSLPSNVDLNRLEREEPFDSLLEEALWQKVHKAVALAIQDSAYSTKRSQLTLTESILRAHSQDDCPFIQNCTACGKPPPAGKKLLLCKQCRVAEYCNKDCQRADWSNHQTFCILSAASVKNTALR